MTRFIGFVRMFLMVWGAISLLCVVAFGAFVAQQSLSGSSAARQRALALAEIDTSPFCFAYDDNEKQQRALSALTERGLTHTIDGHTICVTPGHQRELYAALFAAFPDEYYPPSWRAALAAQQGAPEERP